MALDMPKPWVKKEYKFKRITNLITYGDELNRTPEDLKKFFRSLEGLCKKATARLLSLTFNHYIKKH